MKKELVTIHQAKMLHYLGFCEYTSAYAWRFHHSDKFTVYEGISAMHWSNPPLTIGIPTVDQVIDWLRKKHNVIIYNSFAPFVDPGTKKICYGYTAKWCNLRDGWNGRKEIGRGIKSYDIYAAKRDVITMALRWIKKNRTKKSKK